MRKLTRREIERMLSARRMPEPPEDLADRIKAEIPETLQVGGTGLAPATTRGIPAPSTRLRPLWLIAASLLVVIGAGFVALRLVGTSDDLARQIALDGVVVIKDVVVTVPERSAGDKQKLAWVPSAPRSAPKGERPAASSGALTASKGAAAVTGKTLPVAEGDSRETGGPVAAPAPQEPAATLARARVDEEALMSANAAASDRARPAAVAASMERAGKGSIIVAVQDAAGKPLVGTILRLDLADRPEVNCGSRITGVGGAATFCCVDPGSYRLCAELPSFVPVVTRVVVTTGEQVNVSLTMDHPLADGKEQPWTCPTPVPPADR